MTVVAPVTETYREYPFEAFVEANGSPGGATMREVDEALTLGLTLD